MAAASDAMPSRRVTTWTGSASKTTRRRDLSGKSSSAHGVPSRPKPRRPRRPGGVGAIPTGRCAP
eukprot:13744049-Alexandrium_andersonii.AAC.1